MPPPALLTDDQRRLALADLPGWTLKADGRSLAKTFVFADFNAAFAWMSKVAAVAEKNNHHPDWRNVHRRVEATLTTWDVGGLTALDVDLAAAMDRLAE